jgi:plasmid maintenance system antidote protein VapI
MSQQIKTMSTISRSFTEEFGWNLSEVAGQLGIAKKT